MFWFLLIAMVVVVAAVTLVVVGGDGGLRDSQPDRLYDPLPEHRPLGRADVDAVRLPVALRGYRMTEVDDVLDRLGAELAERDSRIAELEAALAGAHAAAIGAPGLVQDTRPREDDQRGPVEDERPGAPGGQEGPDQPEGEGQA